MPIVSNAGPILSFERAGKLDLLRTVVKELLIPEAVGVELGDDLIGKTIWIGRSAVRDRALVEALLRSFTSENARQSCWLRKKARTANG